MNNFYLAFSVVFPLFLMMSLGYFLKRLNILEEEFLQKLNNLCFKVFLPILLFINIYQSEFEGLFNPKLIGFAIIATLIIFGFLMIIIPRLEKDNGKRGVIIQGIFRSNYVLFGIPVTASIFGESNIGITAILIAFVVPLFNLLSVIALEVFGSKKTEVKNIIIEILKNPLIIASVLALIFIGGNIKIPIIIEKAIVDIGKIATPLALIILGGSFAFKDLKRDTKSLTIAIIGKLVIVPLIAISVSVALGFNGVELIALFAMFGSPTAVSSYTMAQSMGADHVLAGQIVVVGSILSIFSIFVWISILNNLGVLI